MEPRAFRGSATRRVTSPEQASMDGCHDRAGRCQILFEGIDVQRIAGVETRLDINGALLDDQEIDAGKALLAVDRNYSHFPPNNPAFRSLLGGSAPSQMDSRALEKSAPSTWIVLAPLTSTATPFAGSFVKVR